MPNCVALLRGINVGGKNKIAMATLREMFAAIGFPDAKSLLQSGNIVFLPGRQSTSAIEKTLEAQSAQRLKLSVDYFVRTAADWSKIIAANPFAAEAKKDPSHLIVMAFKNVVDGRAVKALQAALKGPEIVRAKGRELFIYYPAGIGTSKLTNAVIEKMIGLRGTARNWNTVMKLEQLLSDDA